MHKDPITHLIAAVLSLGHALDALHQRHGLAAAVSHVHQDSSEHLDEVEQIVELLNRVLGRP